MKSLARQRIRYLIEFGGLYPDREPATRGFVMKVAVVLIALHLFEMWIDYLF